MKYGYCHCGCNKKTTIAEVTINRLNQIKGEPMRFCKGHRVRQDPKIFIKKEHRGYVTKQGKRSKCWIWQRGKFKSGYGRVKRNICAHVYFYKKKFKKIPKGKQLDHLCQIRICCRPSHLEPVTQMINLQRGASTKLTRKQVRYIKHSSKSCTALAAKFNVNYTTIWHILQGNSWTNVA